MILTAAILVIMMLLSLSVSRSLARTRSRARSLSLGFRVVASWGKGSTYDATVKQMTEAEHDNRLMYVGILYSWSFSS